MGRVRAVYWQSERDVSADESQQVSLLEGLRCAVEDPRDPAEGQAGPIAVLIPGDVWPDYL